MLIVLLGMLWAGAAEPACERVSFRLQTLQEAPRPGQEDAADALRVDALRQRKDCPELPLSASCQDLGVEYAREGLQAFEALQRAVAEAQDMPDVGTLITRRRDALSTLGALGDADVQRRSPSVGANDGSVALDADATLDAVGGQLALRTESQAAIFEAEQAWIAAARDWNAALCTCDEACEPAPKGLTRKLTRLHALHADLVAAQRDFLDAWSLDALTDRIRSGPSGEAKDGLTRFRAAALQVALAQAGARPHDARTLLTGLLASLDGHTHRDGDVMRTLIAWVVYDGQWRRHIARLDKHITRIEKAWARVDKADGRTARSVANARLSAAFEALEASTPGAPSGL